jgi:ABC-type multidrug transport system ATPase subunit
MNVSVKNLGVLDQAEFSLGDLTIICGRNNTGKTYAMHAVFGFLSFWSEAFSLSVPDRQMRALLDEGTIRIDLGDYIADAENIFNRASIEYSERLPMVFAAPEERFSDSRFELQISPEEIHPEETFERRLKTTKAELFMLSKEKDSSELNVTLLRESVDSRFPWSVLQRVVGEAVKDIVFGRSLPEPFIVSTERTGAASFRKELDFARNRLLEEMSQADRKNLNPFELLTRVYQDYPLSVKANVDFTRQLEALAKESSFIKEEHPELLEDFDKILGGRFVVTREDELCFVPTGTRTRLTLVESSSSVRSLLDLYFYLHHVAGPGDLLMIDEPELDLHPENQRQIARLFARLVNLGVRVFITTHSDYIIKELNTLIMFEGGDPRVCEFARDEGYKHQELLTPEQLRVYVAEKALILKDGNTGRSQGHTLKAAEISDELGIDARSFDTTIDEMNRIQEEIIWGGE